MKQEAVEASIAAASSKLSYTTAGTMGLAGWITSDIVFGVIGVLIGVATWATNRHYRRKADRREAEYKRKELELEEEYKRRADERDAKEFSLRMRREFGTGWGDL
jgi:flagellar biosynthesis component FlhA